MVAHLYGAVHGSSHSVDEDYRVATRNDAADVDDGSLAFVLLDAAHDYESARADVRAWLPKVRTGGILAGAGAQRTGVLAGVDETIARSEYAVLDNGDSWRHRKRRREFGEWIVRRPHPPDSDHLVYVPYVNNPDFLDRAVRSFRSLWPSLVVIDQSEDGLTAPWIAEISGVYRVPFRAISFTQMMNWARAEAMSRNVRLLAFVHSDAECVGDDVAASVMACARAHLQERVGVTFTHYDAFAVFNVGAIGDIGPWDETFQWYFADNDYYRRMRLLGWRSEECAGSRVRHAVSQTLRSDGRIAADVSRSWEWHLRHYAHKWGGAPSHERFTTPYDGGR
jgi:hypothetical protein